MRYRKLGNSDIQLSIMGMGCWSYGGGSYWGDQSQSDVDRVVAMAIETGINFFDTAEMYNDGNSEISLGQALKGRRDKAVVGTKISTSNATPELLEKHCDASLKRLGVDGIDLYMLHWPINQKSARHFAGHEVALPEVQEVFEGLDRLRQKGKVRYIGVSNHGVKQMEEVTKSGVKYIANQLPYNLISRAIELEIEPYCEQHGIGIIGCMALQQGILAGRFNSITEIPAAQAHSRHFKQERGGGDSRHHEEGAEDEIMALLTELNRMSKELGISVPALSLAFSFANPNIACTLVGSRNIDELKMNIEAAELELPGDVIKKLKVLSAPVLAKLGPSPDFYENRKNSRIY